MDDMVLGRRRTLALAGVGLATVVVLSFLVRFPGTPPQPSTTASVPVLGVQAPPPSPQVHQDLRRSRALLVGLENLEVPARKAVDLRTERKLSRELLQQARDLQERPMDLHTARLVGDVERVLLEIANTDEDATQHVEVIRGGIRQRTCVQIRMAGRLRADRRVERVPVARPPSAQSSDACPVHRSPGATGRQIARWFAYVAGG
jgi:hypothetical protein